MKAHLLRYQRKTLLTATKVNNIVPTYLFFPPADKAQDDIWNYTCEEWGKKQVKKYIIGLHAHLQKLSEKKKLWRTLPNSLIVPSDLDLQAYFSKYEHYFIFFRTLSGSKIGIMSILHESADIPVRLRKDLNKIKNKEPRS